MGGRSPEEPSPRIVACESSGPSRLISAQGPLVLSLSGGVWKMVRFVFEGGVWCVGFSRRFEVFDGCFGIGVRFLVGNGFLWGCCNCFFGIFRFCVIFRNVRDDALSRWYRGLIEIVLWKLSNGGNVVCFIRNFVIEVKMYSENFISGCMKMQEFGKIN